MKFTVKQARAYSGLTQGEMAEKLGVSRATYMQIERDSSRATVKQINEIGKITGIPVRDIILP